MAEITNNLSEDLATLSFEVDSLMRDILQVLGYSVPEDAAESEVANLFDFALAELTESLQFIEEQECSQGGIPAGGDCREAIQPEPLDGMTWTTLLHRRKSSLFLLAKRRVMKFREALRRALFKGH